MLWGGAGAAGGSRAAGDSRAAGGAQGVTDLGQASITENGSSGFHGLGAIRKMLAEAATDLGQASITDKL